MTNAYRWADLEVETTGFSTPLFAEVVVEPDMCAYKRVAEAKPRIRTVLEQTVNSRMGQSVRAIAAWQQFARREAAP